MNGNNPFTGQPIGFRGFSISKENLNIDNINVLKYNQLPLITSNKFPPSSLPGVGGAIAYDIVTKKPYFSDGFTWIPVGLGSTPYPIGSFSFIKNGTQPIPSRLNTVITNWTIGGSDVYHTIPSWDLTSGEYTALKNETLSISIDLAWSSNVSNLGNRNVRVQYKKFGSLLWNTVKEVITQADPDINVQTTQGFQINTKLLIGDSVRITVQHNANIPITIDSGIYSTVSGFLIREF
jgi:hypothetical protein